MAKPLGRRPGRGSSRPAILDAARREFARLGFERATIRSIASEARVDPATIYHFFSSKDDLLRAALEFPLSDEVIDTLLPASDELTGAELLDGVLALWQRPEIAERLTALLRVATTHPDAGAAVSTVFQEAIFSRLADRISADDAELRAGLVGAQLAGLAMLRFVMPFAPIERADPSALVRAVAPTIDRYLTGDLDSLG